MREKKARQQLLTRFENLKETKGCIPGVLDVVAVRRGNVADVTRLVNNAQ